MCIRDRLKTAVAEAYQVYMNEDATADETRAAIRTLSEKAQELWMIVSKAELNALIESAEAISADGYTDLTYRALQAAITAAKSVAANDNATTSEVTTAITNLARLAGEGRRSQGSIERSDPGRDRCGN